MTEIVVEFLSTRHREICPSIYVVIDHYPGEKISDKKSSTVYSAGSDMRSLIERICKKNREKLLK